MGLAGNKKRSKLSADPNNTAWAKSTTSFGHKILSKQGWKPGDFLGAENASHADHYTAANASHIRVMLREENLGIGAKIGTQNAETFGLSMFSGILGRLNGKEEDQAVVKKKEETLRDVQLKLKYGNMNFVSGGLLVGDKMHEVHTDLGHLKDGEVVAVKENRKRKAGEDGSGDEKAAKKQRKADKKANGTAAAIKEMKRQRKLEAGGEVSNTSDAPEQNVDSSSSSSSSEDEKAEKRRRKAERKADRESKRPESGASKDEKARLKDEKRGRKEERRKRKEEKRAKRAAKQAKTSTQPSSAVASESEAPSGTSTPTFMGGRQAVRHRYIMQKRMAAGSAQALKEIFMMKPQVAS